MSFKDNAQDDEKDNDDEERIRFHWANAILIIFLFFSFLINLMIILIHSKQSALRKGFFIVIFVQIIMEAIINLSLLIMNIIYLSQIKTDTWFIIFPVLFNFAHVTNILYNTRIMIYLMTLNKKQDELVNYDLKDFNNFDKDSNLTRQSTIGFMPHSFKSFHIFCFLLSIIHTVLYVLNLIGDEVKIEDEKKWKWFYYFMNGSDGKKRFIFFVFHIIYFCISIPYFILSLNKSRISDHILLRRFSVYCIFSSFICLLFPLAVALENIFKEKKEDIFFIIMFAFIFYLSITWFFRVNCYYIQYVLEESGNGKGFCKKLNSGLKILFCCKGIPSPNFIDLNSSFVYHSLAGFTDFLEENVNSDEEEEECNEKNENKF